MNPIVKEVHVRLTALMLDAILYTCLPPFIAPGKGRAMHKSDAAKWYNKVLKTLNKDHDTRHAVMSEVFDMMRVCSIASKPALNALAKELGVACIYGGAEGDLHEYLDQHLEQLNGANLLRIQMRLATLVGWKLPK